MLSSSAQLIDECKKNEPDIAVILRLVEEEQADVNARDKEDKTPLYFLVHGGIHNESSIKFLIRNKANINIQYFENKTTLLHYACFKNDYEMCTCLLAMGADPNIMDNLGRNALGFLVCNLNYKIEILKLLKEYQVDFNTTAGIDDRFTRPLLIELCYRLTSQHKRNDLDLIEFLIKNKININAQDRDGATALFVLFISLCNDDKYDIFFTLVKLLIKNGADSNILRDPKNASSLNLALGTFINYRDSHFQNCLEKIYFFIKFLIKTGAISNIQNASFTQLLDKVCNPFIPDSNTKFNLIKILLENKNKSAVASLHSLLTGNINFPFLFKYIDLFLKYDVNVNEQNNYYVHTPLHILCGTNNIDSKPIAALLDNGANPNIESKNGTSVLTTALIFQPENYKLIFLLLFNDANLLSKDVINECSKEIKNPIRSIIKNFQSMSLTEIKSILNEIRQNIINAFDFKYYYQNLPLSEKESIKTWYLANNMWKEKYWKLNKYLKADIIKDANFNQILVALPQQKLVEIVDNVMKNNLKQKISSTI